MREERRKGGGEGQERERRRREDGRQRHAIPIPRFAVHCCVSRGKNDRTEINS